MPTDIATLRGLREAATQNWTGPYRLRQETPEEQAEYVARCAAHGSGPFYFISGCTDGGAGDVCHTGNGPTSLANAQWIMAIHTAAPALLDEIEGLRAREHALRKWRTEQDCRYTMGDVADVGGSHCPLGKPCVRCEQERREEGLRAVAEAAREFVLRDGAFEGAAVPENVRAQAALREAAFDDLRTALAALDAGVKP